MSENEVSDDEMSDYKVSDSQFFNPYLLWIDVHNSSGWIRKCTFSSITHSPIKQIPKNLLLEVFQCKILSLPVFFLKFISGI